MITWVELTLSPQTLCDPAGVSFLEGKEDVLEDWREKFFNTWKVRKAPAPSSGRMSPSLLTWKLLQLTARLT